MNFQNMAHGGSGKLCGTIWFSIIGWRECGEPVVRYIDCISLEKFVGDVRHHIDPYCVPHQHIRDD